VARTVLRGRRRSNAPALPDNSLRNTAISLHRLAGWTNIAAATRHHATLGPQPGLTC